MTKDNLGDYELFYMELPPQTDYLNDIEIQDEYGETLSSEKRGLSDQQVLEIAQDSLDDATTKKPSPNKKSEPSSEPHHEN